MAARATTGGLAAIPAWLARRERWSRGLIAFLAGAAMTAGHAPIDFPFLFYLAIPVFVWLLDAAPGGRAWFWTGWMAGFGYFVTGLHWIGHAFLVDAEQFAWLMPFAVTLMPLGLGLFWGLAALACRLVWADGWMRVAGFAAVLTGFEVIRSYIFTGFPWALPGYIWVETPVMQIASWAGPYGTTLITLLITGLPLVALARRQAIPAVAALAAFAGFWVWGAWRVPDEVAYRDDAPVIRLVQPNAAQHLKWVEPFARQFYTRLLELSSKPGDVTPDIVIWPETAVSFFPAFEPEQRARIGTSGNGATMILGGLHARIDVEPRQIFNSLFVLSPEGAILARYDKHHLVPFGEYLPFRPVFDALGIPSLTGRGDFSTGPGPQRLEVPGLPPFNPLICYELIFPYEIIGDGPRPEWILQVTNDAWFGGFAGPQQHLAQARIRAIEFGLPVVRSANTGISAVLDPYGRVLATIGLNSIGHTDQKLPDSITPTTYSRSGDLPSYVILVILLAGGYYLKIRRPPR